MPQLRLSQLVRTFGAVRAVDGISLDVAEGEHVNIVGPSGGGKTTLLRLVAGLDHPDSGRVLFDGRDVTREPPERRGLGMVFQTPALLPHRDVAGNLALPLELKHVAPRERAERVRALATQLGLSDCLSRRPAELSGGEAQRVAIGRALVGGARLLLLDEPFASLDTPLRRQLRELLREIRVAHHLTLLHVTHDQQEALALGNRVVLLDHGRIVQAAAPREIYHRPVSLFAAAFFGEPPMNWLDGRIRAEGGQTWFDPAANLEAWPLPGRVFPPGRVRLGMRPEQTAWGSVDANPGGGWMGMIREIEFAGATSWAVLELPGATWRIPWMTSSGVHVGSRVGVRPDPATAHWFAEDSGQRIESD